MIEPTVGGQPTRHVLYVEGASEEAVDVVALRQLFAGKISVRPMGSSLHVKSVAGALRDYHPNYYFLIDRDHHTEQEVEESWKQFPDPNTRNLLVWRLREIENYFLDPEYLCRCEFLCVPEDELRSRALKHCQGPTTK